MKAILIMYSLLMCVQTFAKNSQEDLDGLYDSVFAATSIIRIKAQQTGDDKKFIEAGRLMAKANESHEKKDGIKLCEIKNAVGELSKNEDTFRSLGSRDRHLRIEKNYARSPAVIHLKNTSNR